MNSKLSENLKVMWWGITHMFPRRWPSDPAERRRIHEGLLIAGAGNALRCGPDGKIRIERETGDDNGGKI